MVDWDRCTEISNTIKNSSEGVSFLSEVVIDEDDLEYILNNFVSIMLHDTSSCHVLTAYMMVIAGLDYDGSYWPHLLKLTNIHSLDNKDQNDLRELFHKGLYELGLDKEVETKRNVEQYLIHTFVPNKEEYMNNFFSFVSSFYKDVLGYELPNDYSESFELLSAIVRHDVQKDQFPSPYALNKCTTYALENPHNYDKIMIKILEIIDAGYKGRRAPSLGNNRFTIPFQRWYMANIGSRTRKSLRREMEMRRARMFLSSGKVKILVPAMKCTSNASLIIKSGRKIIKNLPLETFQVRINGAIMHKMNNDLSLEPERLGVNPFEKIQIEIDGHSILSLKSTEYLLFDENLTRINTLDAGINHILVKDPSIIPTCETRRIFKEDDKNLYYCDLKEGDELIIGDTHLTVMPADSTTEGINIAPLDNVVATSDTEILPVCSCFDVLCSISDVKSSAKVVVKTSVDDGLPYFRTLDVSANNAQNGFFFRRLPEDEHTTAGIHTVFIELICDDKKIDDKKFLLAPGYDYEFNCNDSAYVKETSGILKIHGPIEDEIEFLTSDIHVDVPLPDLKMNLRHIVPSLRIKTGDDKWHNPGDYDIKLDEFLGDYLLVSCNCPSSLYRDRKPIPRQIAEDCYRYDLHEVHKLYNSEKLNNIELEVSLKSKPRFHLCHIWVCNEYQLVEEEDMLYIDVIRHTQNKVVIKIPETNGEFETTSDSVMIEKPTCAKYSVIIKEIDQYGTEHTIVKKDYFKKSIYIDNLTDNSCDLFCHENRITLSFKEKSIAGMMLDYDVKSRFHPWMKNRRSEVFNYLRSITVDQ